MKLFQYYITESKKLPDANDNDSWFELFFSKAKTSNGVWQDAVDEFLKGYKKPSSQSIANINEYFKSKYDIKLSSDEQKEFKRAAIIYAKLINKEKITDKEKADYKEILKDFFSKREHLADFYSNQTQMFYAATPKVQSKKPNARKYIGYFTKEQSSKTSEGSYPWDGFKISGSDLTFYKKFWKDIANDLKIDIKPIEAKISKLMFEIKELEAQLKLGGNKSKIEKQIEKKQEEIDMMEKPYLLNSAIDELQKGDTPLPYITGSNKNYSIDLSKFNDDIHAQWVYSQIKKSINIKITDRITILEDFAVIYNMQSLAKLNKLQSKIDELDEDEDRNQFYSIFGKAGGNITKIALDPNSISDYISAREGEVAGIKAGQATEKGAIKARKNALRDQGLLSQTKAQEKQIEKQIEDVLDTVLDAIELFRKENLSSAITDSFPKFSEFQAELTASQEYKDLLSKIPPEKQKDFKEQLWDNLIKPAFSELKVQDQEIKSLLKDKKKKEEFLKKAGIRSLSNKALKNMQDDNQDSMIDYTPQKRASQDLILEPKESKGGKTGTEWYQLSKNPIKISNLLSSIDAGRSALSATTQGKIDEELNSILTSNYPSYEKFFSALEKKISSLIKRIDMMIEKKKAKVLNTSTERKTLKDNVKDGLGNLGDYSDIEELMGAKGVWGESFKSNNSIINDILKRHKIK